MLKARTTIEAVAVAITAFGLAPWALAQDFPARPIRIVVPFPAGGTTGR